VTDNPRRLLGAIDTRPKKSLGQNFCTDLNILEKIADTASICPEDTVVEIGAGTGALTKLLAEKSKVLHIIEIDRRLTSLLEEKFQGLDRVHFHFGDALKILPALLDGIDEQAVVVGNLPYNISSQLVIRFLERREKIKRAIITLQLEMAQRLCALPGTKDYGALTVRIQTAAETTLMFKISPNCFYPAPEVTSACIRIDLTKAKKPQPEDEAVFVKAVKAGFARRRKQLRNALSGSFPPDQVDSALSEGGIDGKMRAEALSVEQWIRLGNAFVRDCGKK
jgi:16S rRNA (adenine1518-N6/adenine1519-N6)-dimethyltransferase